MIFGEQTATLGDRDGGATSRSKRGITLAALVSVYLLLDLFSTAGPAFASAASTCPVGRSSVTHLAYVIFASDGSSQDVTTLAGHVEPGDQVNVLFDVPPLPTGCATVQLSIASYTISRRRPGQVNLFRSHTGIFLPGGRYEMSTTTAPPSADGLRHVLVDFASGPVQQPPNYGNNLIDSGRG